MHTLEITPRAASDAQPNWTMQRLTGCAIIALLAVLHTAALAQRYSEPIFSEVEVTTDLAYGELEAQRLDMYWPVGDTEVDRLAIVLIHGGAFSGGDKQLDLYIEMAREFAKRGYVAFSINYRLDNVRTNPSIPDTAVADALAALNWIKARGAEFGLDPNKITIAGDSAGGFIVVNLCYQNEAAAGAAACLDLWGGGYVAGTFNAPIYPHPIAAATPPTLMIHGDADRIVPYQTSVDLQAQLEAAEIYHEFYTMEEAGHYPWQRSEEFIAVMVDFVYRRVFLASSATAVIESVDTARLPTSYALEQNFPNPFNSGTVIRFALPSRAATKLAVYNLAGQQVATLVQGVREAGAYSLHWDSRDDNGRALASGTYLYRLEVRDRVENRKLLLLR